MQSAPLLFTFVLTCLEVGATTILTIWASTGNTLYCLTGMYLFASLGLVLGVAIHKMASMNTVNALWQSSSIITISLISKLYFKEQITGVQWVGVFLAFCSSLCFLDA